MFGVEIKPAKARELEGSSKIPNCSPDSGGRKGGSRNWYWGRYGHCLPLSVPNHPEASTEKVFLCAHLSDEHTEEETSPWN